MSIKIYFISGSAPAWRVLLTLEQKKLDYQSCVLETSKNEQKQEWFLALSPRGKVPVLTDEDLVVGESLAIMHYLEKKYPQPVLWGSEPSQTARIEQCVCEILDYADRSITKFVQPVFRKKAVPSASSLASVAEDIHCELRWVEDKLSSSNWLVGSRISAADIVLIPSWQRLKRAIQKAPQLSRLIGMEALDLKYPALTAWDRRIEATPEFKSTFPPHWRT